MEHLPALRGGKSSGVRRVSFLLASPLAVVTDTRNSTGPLGGPALSAANNCAFPLAGLCGIPPDARALAVNVVAVSPSGPGFFTLYPGGTPRPLVSTINYSAGQIRANNGIVRLGAAGDVTVYCGQGSGTAHIVIDVNGYFQ